MLLVFGRAISRAYSTSLECALFTGEASSDVIEQMAVLPESIHFRCPGSTYQNGSFAPIAAILHIKSLPQKTATWEA